jgi:glycosyltransferase involved in cell wall biosynthesis
MQPVSEIQANNHKALHAASKTRRVLMVAYYYPPLGGIGVHRTLKFSKYLPDFNWQPLILTIQPDAGLLRDLSLEQEIPETVQVFRTASLSLPLWLPWRLRNFISRWILVVDEQLGWLPYAVNRGRRILASQHCESIYTTSSPYSDHLIGYRLKKRSGLPWVADFRDPWVGNTALRIPTRLHRFLVRVLEGLVVRQADRVLVVSEPMRRDFIKRYPELQEDKFLAIPNGFDEGDFKDIQPADPLEDQFLLVYSGSFYGERRTPRPFFTALQDLLQRGAIPKKAIQVRFVGNVGKPTLQMIDNMQLRDVVKATGFLPHREAIAQLMAADVLLLIVGPGPGSEIVLPGKIFEYLASGKPILGLVPPGASAELIREASAGVVVDPYDIDGIAAQIQNLYKRWKQSQLRVNTDPKVVAHFSRRTLTGNLAKVLDRVTQPQPVTSRRRTGERI